jgi:anion-transporting  ArsA/GET3 family ATPase
VTTLTKLLEPYDTVVVIGPGGVGKTTTAAAVGALLAQQRRTCVLTIDPAKRLADALGIAEVGNEPVEMRKKKK